MFICMVCVQMSDSKWKMHYLPVNEKREYSVQEWHKHLAPVNRNYRNVYTTITALSLYDINRILGKITVFFETYQLMQFMKSCQEKLHVKWKKMKIVQDCMQTASRDALATLLWNKLSDSLEGRLLHVYEVQRCLNRENINLTLDQLIDCLVVWVWQDYIELQTGIEITSHNRWAKLLGIKTIGYRCRRCLNQQLEHEKYICYSCHDHCMSCSACTQLGKVRSCSVLIKAKREKGYQLQSLNKQIDIHSIISQYKLSHAQSAAVEHLIGAIIKHYKALMTKQAVREQRYQRTEKLNYILWAVTGAGKTEMIFPLIHLFLEWGLKVLIAIPRRDVVQELKPRISQAFQDRKVIALYGGSDQVWEGGHIYIATTHQIIRFDQYFDLVILDEMDAFPYYNNTTLRRTIERVQNQSACFVQLTATIPAKEKINILLKKQKHVKVPVRYHQRALPIPQFKKSPPLVSILKSKELPTILHTIIEQSSTRGAVLFIFLQRKAYLQSFTHLLRINFPDLVIDCTSAEDEQREKKVMLFRERRIHVLVTTSILERGVTIKKSDICIMDVHQKAYNRTAIVQMSGRAGRSIEDTNGYVYLLGLNKTAQVTAAIKEIKAMNLLAKRKGYLKEDGL